MKGFLSQRYNAQIAALWWELSKPIMTERKNQQSKNGVFGLKQKITPSGKGGRKIKTGFDWDGFKKKEFAVLCEVNKERFFYD